jgi:hypothetical protein
MVSYVNNSIFRVLFHSEVKKMKKGNFWLGILVIGLVFGMTVVGCDNGSTNDSTGTQNSGGGSGTGGTGGGTGGTGGTGGGGTRPGTPQGVNLQTYSRTNYYGGTDIYYTITWNAASGATSYNIYKATEYNGSYVKNNISPIISTSLNNFYGTYGENLTSWPNAYFKITAVNSYGESDKSSIVYITRSAIGGY